MQRRWFIQGVLAGGAAVVATTTQREANAVSNGRNASNAAPLGPTMATAPAAEAPDLPAPARAPRAAEHEGLWPLLAPLTEDAEVAPGWRVQEVSKFADGAAVVTLAGEHGEVRVHVCRRDENDARSMTHSEHTDLYLMNGGDGLRPTDESLAVAVETLALILRRNEEQGVELPDALMTHAARLNFFATDRKLL